jgi:thioredoxin 1
MNLKIYKFSATWCDPCKQLTPILNELLVTAELSSYLEEIDIEKNEDLVEKYTVTILPTIIIVKDEQVFQRIETLDIEKLSATISLLQNLKEKMTRQSVEFVPIDIAAAIQMDF